MNPENIAVILSESDLGWLADVMRTAAQNSQKVSLTVDGGLKVKVGESMWTPPMGTTLAKINNG